MERCLAWRIYRDNKDSELHQLLFKGGFQADGKTPLRFYLPYRCEEVGTKKGLCEGCKIRSEDPELTKPAPCGSYQNYYLGNVNEPIRAVNRSRMAFSPWFLERVKEFGISPENLAKARAAWAAAVAGLKDVPPLPDMGDAVVTEVPNTSSWTPVGNEKKKRAPAKKKVAAESAPVVQEAKSVKKPSKIKLVKALAQTSVLEAINQSVDEEAPLVVAPPQVEVKVKRAYKKKVVTSTALPPPPPIAILSEEKPVDVDNLETIEVIARELNGTNYYLDTRKNKVYNPKNGSYVGRWDSVTEKLITSIPDSDHEA